jgi:hypothetical protein
MTESRVRAAGPASARDSRAGTSRRWISVAAVLCAGWLLRSTALDFRSPFDDAPFDAHLWQTGGRAIRAPMARAAIDRMERGMTRAELLELLGEPDSERETRGYAGHFGERFPAAAIRTLRYELESSSRASAIGLDDAFLYVHLDEAGNLVGGEIGGG